MHRPGHAAVRRPRHARAEEVDAGADDAWLNPSRTRRKREAGVRARTVCDSSSVGANVLAGVRASTWRGGDTSTHPLGCFDDPLGRARAPDASTGEFLLRNEPDVQADASVAAAPVSTAVQRLCSAAAL